MKYFTIYRPVFWNFSFCSQFICILEWTVRLFVYVIRHSMNSSSIYVTLWYLVIVKLFSHTLKNKLLRKLIILHFLNVNSDLTKIRSSAKTIFFLKNVKNNDQFLSTSFFFHSVNFHFAKRTRVRNTRANRRCV